MFSFKSLTQRTEKPTSLLLLFLFTLLLLLFMLRFHAFVALFSVALHQLPLLPMLLNVPLLLRLPPGRPDVIVTTVVLATQYHFFLISGLYSCSGLPDLIGTLLFALTFRTLTGNYFSTHRFLPS